MVRIREFIIFEPGKYILSSSAQARIEIDSQRLKFTFPSPTHTVPVTWNSGVFQGSLGPVDNALYIIPSQASLKAMNILYWRHQWCLQDLRCSADKNFKSKELSRSSSQYTDTHLPWDKSEMSHSIPWYEFRATLMKSPAIITNKKDRPSDHLSCWYVLLGTGERALGSGCPCHYCHQKLSMFAVDQSLGEMYKKTTVGDDGI